MIIIIMMAAIIPPPNKVLIPSMSLNGNVMELTNHVTIIFMLSAGFGLEKAIKRTIIRDMNGKIANNPMMVFMSIVKIKWLR